MAVSIGMRAHDVIVLRRESAQQLGRAFRFDSTPSVIETLFRRIAAVHQAEESIAFRSCLARAAFDVRPWRGYCLGTPFLYEHFGASPDLRGYAHPNCWRLTVSFQIFVM